MSKKRQRGEDPFEYLSNREKRKEAERLRRYFETHQREQEKKAKLNDAKIEINILELIAKTTTRNDYYKDNVPNYVAIRSIIIRILSIKNLLREAGTNQLQAQSYEVDLLRLFVEGNEVQNSLFSFRDMNFSDWLRIVIDEDGNNILFNNFCGSNECLMKDQSIRAERVITSLRSKGLRKLILLDGIGRFLSILGSKLGPEVDNYEFEIPEIDRNTIEWHNLFFPKNVIVSTEEYSILDINPSNSYIVYFNFCSIRKIVRELHKKLCSFIESNQPVFVSWSLEGSCNNKALTDINRFAQFWRRGYRIKKSKHYENSLIEKGNPKLSNLTTWNNIGIDIVNRTIVEEYTRRGFFTSIHAYAE